MLVKGCLKMFTQITDQIFTSPLIDIPVRDRDYEKEVLVADQQGGSDEFHLIKPILY